MELIFPISMGFTVLLLVGLGIMVKYYKAYWLISGYNTMSKEEQRKVDVEGLAGFSGNTMFVMAAIFLVATILIMLGQEGLGAICFALFIPFTIYFIVKAQKYDGNTRNSDGTMTTKAKWTVAGISALLAITALGVGILFYYSNQPTEVIFENGYFEIRGMYGEKIPISEVSELTLKDTLPRILAKTNGSSIGSKKRGYFSVEDIGSAKLFVDTSKPPFIYFEGKGKRYILNFDESEETEAIFQSLDAERKNLK